MTWLENHLSVQTAPKYSYRVGTVRGRSWEGPASVLGLQVVVAVVVGLR